LEKEQLEKGLIPNIKAWEKQTFQQERDHLIQKLEEVEDEITLK
jgi:hypothetical protein